MMADCDEPAVRRPDVMPSVQYAIPDFLGSRCAASDIVTVPVKQEVHIMSEVSTLRLYVLRGMYLLIAVGLAIGTWPAILSSTEHLSPAASQFRSVLCAVSLLALLGIRYPLKM